MARLFVATDYSKKYMNYHEIDAYELPDSWDSGVLKVRTLSELSQADSLTGRVPMRCGPQLESENQDLKEMCSSLCAALQEATKQTTGRLEAANELVFLLKSELAVAQVEAADINVHVQQLERSLTTETAKLQSTRDELQQERARAVKAAEPIANPLPVAAVVFPRLSKASVR